MTTVPALVKDWLDHCRAEGLQPSTMRNYAQVIDYILLPFCVREGIEDVQGLDQAALDRLATELLSRPSQRNGKPLSRASVDSYLRPVRKLTDYGRSKGFDLLGRPTNIRQGKAPKDVLTREELQQMENAAVTERDKLIVRLLADTGMRIGELVKLRPSDLIERNRQWFLYVRGKGRNDRFVPVPRIHRRLRTWAESGRRQPCADLIFTVLHARGGFYPGISYAGAWKIIRNVADAAQIRKRVHPHLLRHTFITHLRRKGLNDAQISLVVGNWTTLQSYTWLEAGDAYGFMGDLG